MREAAFFAHDADLSDIVDARVLALLGDSVTTDHISPAGAFAPGTPAGHWLTEHGVEPRDFNSYGARRGNHEVMVRGTFANIRLRNALVEREGGYTRHLPSGEEMTIYDAAERYRAEGVPLVVIAGREYGSGSSRDWAAKGSALLGRAGRDRPELRAHPPLEPGRARRHPAPVRRRRVGREPRAHRHARRSRSAAWPTSTSARTCEVDVDGGARSFTCLARLDAPADVKVYRAGGLLQMVMTPARWREPRLRSERALGTDAV